MTHAPRTLALVAALACGTSPLTAQIQLRPGFGIGVMVPMGDLATAGPAGATGHVFLMARGAGNRYAFGLEGVYHQTHLDSVFVPGFDTVPGRMIGGSTWKAFGAMIRYEYDITRGLFAIGGGGILWRDVVPPDDAPSAETMRTHDFAAQAGLGYRGPAGLRIEARVVNIFTVNDSERFLPITIGLAF